MKKLKVSIILFISLFTSSVFAASKSDSVGSDLTLYSCTKFQDSSIEISGDTYFGRCMEAKCNGSTWNLKYYSSDTVSCSNGNINPYIDKTKNGCSKYQGSCNNNSVKYCTTITYFDCERTSNGSKYTTTTKTTTKKPTTTTKPKTTTTTTQPTTVVTEPVKNNNTYLSGITLSTGSINFNKDVKEYSIEVGTNISFITVDATPEVGTSSVSVSGNSNIVAGDNTITITVTAEDGSTGTYIIKVKKEEILSNNAKLSSIKINDEVLSNFSSTNYVYTYKTKETSLRVEAETEDTDAIYMVSGADNIKDGSTVKVTVTAPDGLTMQEYSINIKVPSGSAGIITVIFIIIILVVIGGGIFYFYSKRKNGGEKEYEYE